jgi:hypothetical protein
MPERTNPQLFIRSYRFTQSNPADKFIAIDAISR